MILAWLAGCIDLMNVRLRDATAVQCQKMAPCQLDDRSIMADGVHAHDQDIR